MFVGGREGYFQALDARSGMLLWKAILGGEVAAAPISYGVDGKQYIAVAAGGNTNLPFKRGNDIIAFALY